MASNQKPLNPRTARVPAESEQKYVIAHGAPQHYVNGYGLCGPGSIVSLEPGVTPGRWYVEVSPEDAEKAQASETDAQRLAVLAAAKIQAKANDKDVERKVEADKARREQAGIEAQEAAQREADAIKRAADAEASAKAATDETVAAKQRADELQKQLDKANTDLAAAQAQLDKANAKPK